MARSASPWDQPDDPRDHTVDLPRMDVGGLTGHLRGTAPLPEQEPSGQLEPLPEQEPAGQLEPLPAQEPAGQPEPLPAQEPAGQGEPLSEPEPRPAPGSLYGPEPRSYSLPPISSRPGGLHHPYAEPLVTDRRPPTTLAPEPAASGRAVSDQSARRGTASNQAAPAPAAPAPAAPAPPAPASAAAAISSELPRAAGVVEAPRQAGSRTLPQAAGLSAAFSPASRAPTGSLADLRSRLARLPDGHPSSPYEDDGRARPLPVRLKQLELGLPAPGRDFAGGFAADVGELEASDPVRADEPAADLDSALAGISGSSGMSAAHDEPTPFPEQNESGHPADRELTDPYAGEGNGRATPVRADLTLRQWQPSPSPRLSGAESVGSNGHDVKNGHGKLAQERPVGGAGGRDTAQPRIADPPTADLRDLVERTLATCRAAEGRNVLGSYGASGVTPAMQRLAAHLPFGGLAPDSEASSLKTAERLTAKLTRLIARNPGRTPEELAAGIGDVVRYAFAFEAADYVEGTWLVHRRLKSHGFELEIRRNRWESPEYKGIFTQWRDPAHDVAFEVQFHTTASWSVAQRTHPAYVQITDPATPPAERARLRARQVAAAATAKPPPNWTDIGDFRLEAR